MSFVNIPSYNWLSPVDALIDLPPEGSVGDVRMVVALGTAYWYNGTIWAALAGGGGGSTNSFAFIQTDSGTYPAASNSTDTLTFTTNESNIATFVGNAVTDTVDLTFKYTPENVSNKDNGTLTSSTTTYPTSNAVKSEMDLKAPLNDPRFDIYHTRVVQKAPGAGQFLTITDAIASITGSSTNNPYVIKVGPGIFDESAIILPEGVSVVGSSIYSTIVRPAAANHHVFQMGLSCEVSFLSIQNAGSGYAGVAVLDLGFYAQLHKVSMQDNDIHILITSATVDTTMYCEYVDINGTYTYGIKLESTNGFLSNANCENFYAFPTSNTQIDVLIDGSAAYGEFELATFTGAKNSGIIVTNGGELECRSVEFDNLSTAILADNNGTGSIVQTTGCKFIDNTISIDIINTTTTGYCDGYIPHGNYSIINGSTFFIVNQDQNYITVGKTGFNFTSISDACSSILNASPNHHYAIRIYPGIYIEPLIQIPDYTSIYGESINNVVIRPNSNNHHVIKMGIRSEVSFLTIDGSPVQSSIIYDTVTFTATTPGITGNSITLIFNGILDLDTVVNAWNAGNPTNTVSFSGQIGSYVPTSGTITLSGGLNGCGSGYAGIACVNSGSFSVSHKVSIYDCDIGILTQATTIDSSHYAEYVDIENKFTDGIKCIGASASPYAYVSLQNYYSGSTDSNINHINMIGPGASVDVLVGTIYGGIGTDTAINIENGAILKTTSIDISGVNIGIHIPNSGTNSSITFEGLISSITSDILIESPNAIGNLSGTWSSSKTTIDPNSTISAFYVDAQPADNIGSVTIKDIYQGERQDRILNLSKLVRASSTMGLIINGGDITLVSGRTVEVSAGSGFLVDPTDLYVKEIIWTTQQITIPANVDHYLFFNTNGTLVSNAAQQDLEQVILLGRIKTDTADIDFIESTPMTVTQHSNEIEEMLRYSLGPIFGTGAVVSENGTRGLDVTPSTYYYGSVATSAGGGAPIAWEEYFHTSSVWDDNESVSQIQNTSYDNGTNLVAFTPSYFRKDALYLIGGNTEKYFIVTGRSEFSTQPAAEAGNLPTAPTWLRDSIVLIASIVIQQGATNLKSIQDLRPRVGFKTGSTSSGVTAHGDLTGLLNDDHPQYLLISGTRAMTANLAMGGQNITGVNLVDGVDVSAHEVRHLPNGADPLTTAAAVSITTANAEGVANSFARSDHTHAGVSSYKVDGGTARTGTINLVSGFGMAISDDGVGNVTLDTTVATAQLVTTHTTLLNIAYTAGNVLIDGVYTAISAGSITVNPNSVNYYIYVEPTTYTVTFGATLPNNCVPMAKYTSNVSTVTALTDKRTYTNPNIVFGSTISTVGTANSAGTDNSFTRMDHVHAHGSHSTGTDHAAVTTLVNGFMSSTDKTKLDAATNLNTASTLVFRDSSNNFSAGTITASLTGNVSGSAASFTGSLSGDVTGNQGSTAIAAAVVTSKLLTGFSSGAGTVSITDSILTGINKLDGNIALKAPISNPTFTGTASGSFSGSLAGNASTSTTLQTARAINGVNFDGSAPITVTADANTLTGTTLKSTVVNSSLTSVGTIATGTWSATTIASNKGGTGQTADFVAGGVIYGNTTTAMGCTAVGIPGQVLTSADGLTPIWSTPGPTLGQAIAISMSIPLN